MEANILSVLQTCDGPLTAKEIAQKIGCTKKDVNQVIYKMNGVVKKPDTQPPKWLLAKGTEKRSTKEDSDTEKDSTELPITPKGSGVGSEADPKGASPNGATPVGLSDQRSSTSVSSSDSSSGSPPGSPTDAELKEKITHILVGSSSPLSAPDISRKLQHPPKHTAVVKKILHEMERKGDVKNTSAAGQKPLWIMGQMAAVNGQAKLDNKGLYTFENSANGVLQFSPVYAQGLVDHAMKRTPDRPEVGLLQQPRPPMLECVNETPSLPSDVKPDKSKTAVQGGSDKETPFQGRAASNKSRIKLAAKFESEVVKCEQRVLELLQSCPHQWYTCNDVKEELGLETRDIALSGLRALVNKCLVLEQEPKETGGTRKFKLKSP